MFKEGKGGKLSIFVIAAIGVLLPGIFFSGKEGEAAFSSGDQTIELPPPRSDSETSVEEALFKRRSVRDYQPISLTLAEVSQLLWAAQGISEKRQGLRTAPSAGALYPLEIYLVSGKVEGLPAGVYHYQPEEHQLLKITEGDKREALCRAALYQKQIKEGAIVIVFSAIYERTTAKYGERGIRYVHMEAGHAAQNVYLQAVSLNLHTVAVGAFHDKEVKKVLGLEEKEHPLYLLPVGK